MENPNSVIELVHGFLDNLDVSESVSILENSLIIPQLTADDREDQKIEQERKQEELKYEESVIDGKITELTGDVADLEAEIKMTKRSIESLEQTHSNLSSRYTELQGKQQNKPVDPESLSISLFESLGLDFFERKGDGFSKVLVKSVKSNRITKIDIDESRFGKEYYPDLLWELMGLSGRKEKQRIAIDPQNKAWKESGGIGEKLLLKMGWEGGALKNGSSENIKVSLKLNSLGIGANKKTSQPEFGFDDLLKDINSSCDSTVFIYPSKDAETVEGAPRSERKLGGRHLHRQKFIRNKQVSNYDDEQVNNILGMTRDGLRQGEMKPIIKPEVAAVVLPVEDPNLLVKSIGMGDYFAQKMAAKALAQGKVSKKRK